MCIKIYPLKDNPCEILRPVLMMKGLFSGKNKEKKNGHWLSADDAYSMLKFKLTLQQTLIFWTAFPKI